MSRPRLRRYPVESLVTAAGARTVSEISQRAELTRSDARALWPKKSRGVEAPPGLTSYQADRLACRLGLHPTLVWGDDWEADQ